MNWKRLFKKKIMVDMEQPGRIVVTIESFWRTTIRVFNTPTKQHWRDQIDRELRKMPLDLGFRPKYNSDIKKYIELDPGNKENFGL